MSGHGFQVCKVYETYSGQFLCIEASPTACSSVSVQRSIEERERFVEDVSRFPRNFQNKLDLWREQLDGLNRKGRRAVVWGAGSKGVSFLNMLPRKIGIEYLVDINPRKLGKFIPGSGQKIIPPEFLRSYRPDVVIVMNPNYRDEIAGMAREQDLAVEFLFA